MPKIIKISQFFTQLFQK